MCCEGTAVGLKLPADGVNKHRSAYKQELMCEWRKATFGKQKDSVAMYIQYYVRAFSCFSL
jgi:hypothetical protein